MSYEYDYEEEKGNDVEENFDWDEEQEYKAEIKVDERTVKMTKMDELLGMAQITAKGKQIYTIDQKFLLNINTFSKKIIESEKNKFLSVKDIDVMLEMSKNVSGLKYKNFAGYVVGYILTSGGLKQVEKSEFKKVSQNKTIKSLCEDVGVYPEDMVRYARFWIKLRGKTPETSKKK